MTAYIPINSTIHAHLQAVIDGTGRAPFGIDFSNGLTIVSGY